MRLSLKGRIKYLVNFIPFLLFSIRWEKRHENHAKAEGLSLEEYKKKYFIFDNSDGRAAKVIGNPWEN